jgi:hypothetical protein
VPQEIAQVKPQTVNFEQVVKEATKNNRVCPMPQKWNELYNLLPNQSRKGNGWEPALPLILGAWHDTPNLFKTIRLREHIEWASSHGELEKVDRFIVSLPKSEWHHLGD